MYLKRLTLAGFKSFADPTEFHFHPGTTGIVGPNGCGKSNIVDAFRWVLGERRAKELRGSEMLDVIFNGAGGREPMSRAEVALVFDNSDQALALESSEVEVARRLYRSGESEYLINRKACRLKDILALFADTGIGAHGYSVLEQGNVDGFLHSNALERRSIFEEAAGISRYKKQRTQTLRQLERTEQNLARLQDIFGEIERRIRSVKLQATKAQRYLADRELVQQMRTVLADHDLGRFRMERGDLSFALALADLRRGWLAAVGAELESEHARARAAVDDARQALAALRTQEMELRVALEGADQRRTHLAERVQELGVTRERRADQRQDLESVTAQYEQRRQERRAELRQGITALRGARHEFAAAEQRRQELSAERARREAASQAAQEEALAHLYAETRASNERSSLEADLRGLQALRERRERELDEFTRELAEHDAQRARCTLERSTVVEDAQRLRVQVQELRGEIDRRMAVLDDAQRNLNQIQERFKEDQARLRSLERLEQQHEGVGRGVRRLLEANHPLSRDVVELLAEAIEADALHAPMVDAVLGQLSELVIFNGGPPVGDRARALTRLLDGDGLTFCQAEGDVRPGDAWPAAQSGSSRLLDRVSFDPRYRTMLEAICGDVYVAEHLEAALARVALPGETPRRYVTPDGSMIEPWGAVTLPGRHAAGLVSRRTEIQFLRTELVGQEQALHRAREHGAGLELAIEARREEMARLEAEIRRRQLEAESLQRKEADATRSATRCRERLDTIGRELAELERDRASRQQALTGLVERIAQVQGQREQCEATARSLEESLGAVAVRVEEAEREVSRLRVTTTQQEERIVALLREERRLLVEIAERNARRAALDREDAEHEARIAQHRQEDADLHEKRCALVAQLEELDRQVRQADAQVHERGQGLELVEQQARRVRSTEDELRGRREEYLVRDQELRLRMAGLREKLREDFQIELTEAPLEEWRRVLQADASEDELTFTTRLRSELEEVSERLRRNANVNLEAVHELSELEQRQAFLSTQLADLEQARGTLTATIESLNERSRELFLETFATVRGHFIELFKTIFGGGEADLRLEDGIDPLEAGIEVVARPPGKKIQSLKLLSGGEKALTAISVQFALFRAKPSPFCILDEVDAPLDEANIRRFVRALREFVDTTQFLIVTHSKVTMSKAERLYGITMQERGVSRVIGVQLEQVEAMGLLDPPTRPVEEASGTGTPRRASVPVDAREAVTAEHVSDGGDAEGSFEAVDAELAHTAASEPSEVEAPVGAASGHES